MRKNKEQPHLWCYDNGDYYCIGLTQEALVQMGTVTYAEIKDYRCQYAKGDVFAIVETAKQVFEIKSPFDGFCRHIFWVESQGPLKDALNRNWKTILAYFDKESVTWEPDEWEEYNAEHKAD